MKQDSTIIESTKAEKKFIERLQKLMDKKPKSLWFFSNGTMHVMKYGKDGNRVMKGDGVDSNYTLSTIDNIVSDGGDW